MARPLAAPWTLLVLLVGVGSCDVGPDAVPEGPAPSGAELDEGLTALGYVAGTDPPGSATGVTRHETERVQPGLNFFTSGHGPVAVLMDMEGAVLHEWRAGFRELFPKHPLAPKGAEPRRNFWRVARLLPNGDVIGIWDLYGIFKLDRHSKILWVVPERAHHDLHVTEDGRIHHLEAVRRRMPEIPEGPAVDDYIVVRDENGVELSRLAISTALGNARWPELRKVFWLRETARGYGLGERARFDPFHTNALQILSPDDARRLGAPFRAGDALVSMAMLDTIAVIDTLGRAARWWWQGPFGMQHHPRVTPDGRIVLFNNHRDEERSSVQILDPRTRRVIWEYTASRDEPLYSARSAGAEVLPNGNVLIVETDRGRVLEVTPGKDVVWEFRNPFRAGKGGDRVAQVYALERVPASRVAWLTR